MPAIFALGPAERVAIRRECERAGGLERKAHAPLDLRLHPVDAEIVDRIFEAGVRAHRAIAMIALDADHRVGRRKHPVLGDEADHVGEPRIGLRRLISAAHAAANRDVVAFQLALLRDGDEAKVLSVDVDVVVRRNDEAGLEFTRQILLAEERLFGFGGRHPLLAVPDFMIGAQIGPRVVAEALRRVVDFRVQGGEAGIDGGHDAAHDVAAGGDGVDQDLVQPLGSSLSDRSSEPNGTGRSGASSRAARSCHRPAPARRTCAIAPACRRRPAGAGGSGRNRRAPVSGGASPRADRDRPAHRCRETSSAWRCRRRRRRR